MTPIDYIFPTEAEELDLIGEVAKIFTALGMESTLVPLIPDEFAKMLFTLNPDIFGNRLENAERWLKERIERAEREKKKERGEQMREFLTDFPTTTAH